MNVSDDKVQPISRRAFIQRGSLVLTASASLTGISCSGGRKTDLDAASLGKEHPAFAAKPVRFGIITDLHYADKPHNATRYYQESVTKLVEASVEFAVKQIDFVVELGDLIDSADSVDTELGYLETINKEFAGISKDRHYVLGNHCVDMLTKEEFLGGVEQAASYYSFDRGHVHFVVLDACFRSDGEPYGRKNSNWDDSNVPRQQLEWLKADLKGTQLKTIVLVHQRLDATSKFGIRNSPQVRKILEDSGKVLAVLQGHSHQNDLTDMGTIHYCTLRAMVEGSGIASNGYSVVDVAPDGTIQISGFRQQAKYEWKPTA